MKYVDNKVKWLTRVQEVRSNRTGSKRMKPANGVGKLLYCMCMRCQSQHEQPGPFSMLFKKYGAKILKQHNRYKSFYNHHNRHKSSKWET